MKELQKEFDGRGEVKGTRFVQRLANEYAFLYECFPDNSAPYFEVFKRKENNYFECVSFPTSKAFGRWAWTTHSASRAREIFDNITKKSRSQLNAAG